jgi:hypothetical protein
VSGRVDSVVGICPTLVLEVKKRTILTTKDTTFSKGSCRDVDRGSMVTVTGISDVLGLRATSVVIDKK